MTYTPPKKILKNYANVLVNFALGDGKGVKKGDVVYISINEVAKPLLRELTEEITKKGARYILNYIPAGEKNALRPPSFYKYATDGQLSFVPQKYFEGIISQVDHVLLVVNDIDESGYKSAYAKKIVRFTSSMMTLARMRVKADAEGKLSWTASLYPTKEGAKNAGLSLRNYWDEVINACFLNAKDPIKKWKEVTKNIYKYKDKLNKLKIKKLHTVGDGVDLWIDLGEKRKWIGGGGRNIPTFELFTSPDWRGTNGYVNFTQPVFRNGGKIDGIKLAFKNGKVVKASAESGEKILKEMLKQENANKIGEFSLTDKRFSRIKKFMANTLYDENVGGEYGNFHIAIGNSYKICYDGDLKKVKNTDWRKLGFNESQEHTDLVSTSKRSVYAYTKNGTEKLIYKDGKFLI